MAKNGKAVTDATFSKPVIVPEKIKSNVGVNRIAEKTIKVTTNTSDITGELSNGIPESVPAVSAAESAPFDIVTSSTCPQGIATVTYGANQIDYFLVPTGVTSVTVKAITYEVQATSADRTTLQLGKNSLRQVTTPTAAALSTHAAVNANLHLGK